MAVQPLSPATDRRLGGPLPHQPANQTRVHLVPPEFFTLLHAKLCAYAVLAVVSNCCPPLKGRFLTRYSPVRHCPLLQLDESSFHRFSFDLHVLSTPPAFVLSQDQTLYKSYLNGHSRSNLYRAICHSFKNFLYLPSRVIDLTPFRQVSQLRSGLFSQPLALPSGAFRFVRCLIYKVHVP